MGAWAKAAANSRDTLRAGKKYAKDIQRQIEKNGGYTEAESYAVKHAEELEDLYRRAGVELPEQIRAKIREVREHARRIEAQKGETER